MSAGEKEDCFVDDDVRDDDDFDEKRAKALEEVFDAVARYGEKREKHERTTREATMSIAAARYALGRVGWESVVGTTKMTTAISVTNEEEEEEEEEETERTTTKMEPAQARVVRRKFRELTRASAEVLSIKSALERKVKRYEREYGSAM